MTKNFIGRFYLKLTDSKNLIGEFSNNHENCKRNYGESADRIIPDACHGNFVGEYYHTWYDDFESSKPGGGFAKLKIEPKSGCVNIYSLNWWGYNETKKTFDEQFFWGEGMLCDGMLIGDYRNFPSP